MNLITPTILELNMYSYKSTMIYIKKMTGWFDNTNHVRVEYVLLIRVQWSILMKWQGENPRRLNWAEKSSQHPPRTA